MDKSTIHILLVEDEKGYAKLVRLAFERHAGRFHLTVAGNLEQARAYLAESLPNLVIADWFLPDGRGTDLLPAAGEARRFPLVVMTSHGDEQLAVESLKAGALDYIAKSEVALADLPRVAERALREWGYIVDRQQAEESLKASEERYRTMIENANDIIWTLDTAGHFTFVNHQAEIISGYKSEEGKGKLFAPPIYPDDLEMVNEVFQKTLSGESRQYTVRCYKKNGEIFILSVNTAPIYEKSEVVGTVSFGRDITARVRAEKALQESERQLQTLIDAMPDFICFKDGDGRWLKVNDAGIRIFQLEGIDYRGKKDSELAELNSKLRGTFLTCKKSDARVWKEGNLIHGEETVPDSTGSVRVYDVIKVPVSHPDGERKGLVIIGHDITERQQAEEALRATESLQRTVIESLDEALHLIDTELCIRLFNRKLEEWSGQLGLETGIVGRHIQDTFPFLSDTVISQYQQVFKTGEPLITQERTTFDNRAIITETRKVPVKTGEKVTGVLTVMADITERVQAAEERELLLAQIREQAQQMQETIATVPEGVLLLDTAQRVILANPVAEGDLVVLADAKVGDILTRLGDHPLAELLTSPPTKGLWHEVLVPGSVGDRPERIFEVLARPIEVGPTAGGWVLVIRDVTQEREIQRRTQQQERLVALGQLAAGVAHDFNNIMTTILLYTQMSLNAPDLPTQTRQRLETVSRQAYRATDLVQQILDFSRRAVLERRPMDLTSFLKEAVKLLERIVPESIKIRLTYGADEYTVHADPTRLQQAIMNLALNARDTMPEGGELRIELERVQVKSHKEPPLPEMAAGEWVQIRVTDTGNGIPPNVLPHIFEPFFTTKEVGQGTGLGLAQVYGIVKQHGGHIDVSTEVGAGSTFTLYLPALLASPPEVAVLETPTYVQGQGETVLVVEDNAALREALTDTLEVLNYQVLKAADGREALNILEQRAEEVALVLSDLVMPEMGGQALFHAMRQRGLTLPVVMLSGHPMEHELEELQAQGLAGWMLKPPDLEQLSQLLARALRDEK